MKASQSFAVAVVPRNGSNVAAPATDALWESMLTRLRTGGPAVLLDSSGRVLWTSGPIRGFPFAGFRKDGLLGSLTPTGRAAFLEALGRVVQTGRPAYVLLDGLIAEDQLANDGPPPVALVLTRVPPGLDGDGAVVIAQAELAPSDEAVRAARLETALRRVVAELARLDERANGANREPAVLQPLPQALPRTLSPRRRQVAEAMLRGRSVNGVARELGLSPHTVRNHLKAVYRELGVTSRAELLLRYHA